MKQQQPEKTNTTTISNNQNQAGVAGKALPAVPVLQKKDDFKNDAVQTEYAVNAGETIQKKENKTGLPDSLKSGVEGLSGIDISDVKVHYNSSQPAQLNAHAYAQGTDIHLAPGQEKHLPHEAWHVVQQKQGRVAPTTQMKGFAINDDKGLEAESDVMGAKATQFKLSDYLTAPIQSPTRSGNPAQLTVQLEKVSADMGAERVTAESNNGADTLAFLQPGARKAPVHLTKGVKNSAIGVIRNNNPLTHDTLHAERSDAPNYHFTLTSGFMTAALVNSNIKRHMVKKGKAVAIWNYQSITTATLSQNKLAANNIVSAFNTDLGLAQAANFDNLMFSFNPGGGGPTFDEVVAFHDSVKDTLFAVPDIDTGDSSVPFSKIKYAQMRAEIVAGADALAAQWNNWTGGAVAGITRNSFKIGPDKWTDLAKALNILNRISVKAQTDEGEDHAAVPFDGAFVDNRLAGPGAARTAVKENMATHNALFAGELG